MKVVEQYIIHNGGPCLLTKTEDGNWFLLCMVVFTLTEDSLRIIQITDAEAMELIEQSNS